MRTFAPELAEDDTIVGLPVFDCEGERVGLIEESFVDVRSAQTVFVVIGTLPGSELGDERFVVPARKLRVVHGGDRRWVVLQAGLSVLMAATHWSELRWTDTVNARWVKCIDRHDRGLPQEHSEPRSPRSRFDATVGPDSLRQPRGQAELQWAVRDQTEPSAQERR
jgi:hypothetical protein